MRGFVGTDLPKVTSTIAPITSPFTGEELMAVPALNPDVAMIHAQQPEAITQAILDHLSPVLRERR